MPFVRQADSCIAALGPDIRICMRTGSSTAVRDDRQDLVVLRAQSAAVNSVGRRPRLRGLVTESNLNLPAAART